jgi:hypothetical protein
MLVSRIVRRGKHGRFQTHSTVALVILGGAVALGGGCGVAAHPPLIGDGLLDAGPDGPPSLDFDATIMPPGCNVGPEAGVCGCLDLPLALDAPNLYFVLDRSGSMNDLGKWDTVRADIGQLLVKIGPRANFGAAVFPDPANDACSTGVEVVSTRPGDSPAGTYGPTIRAMALGLGIPASGGTPTAATFVSLQSTLIALPGRTFVILATDGAPNCDANAGCAADQCQVNIESADPNCPPGGPPNCCDAQHYGPLSCNDDVATANAIAALKSAGVPTYVIGEPGSAVYANILDHMATAGGTARASEPLYYAVGTADQGALMAALSQIVARVTATCTLPLGMPPPDPTQVNVYLDNIVVPKDPVNGWTLGGSVVTLVGTSCQRVLNGDVLSVRVIAGCPTVLK